jgi:DNA polymerase
MPKAKAVSAAPFVPASREIPVLAKAAQSCQGCELYLNATQAVFGEGPSAARVIMVGEQPGDSEDRQGKPFVGPAGRLLDKALEEAGIDRNEVYVTNAVKHFKFVERGKRRLHQKPRISEVTACKPWLEAEVSAVHPEIIVCLGATAAQAILGPKFRITRERGTFLPHAWAQWITTTVHPSSILRAPDAERRQDEYRLFVADLKGVRERLGPVRT